MTALVDPRELIGHQEAVTITGISRQAFHTARLNGRIPKPITTLACGPIWTRSQIEQWTADRVAARPS